MPSQFCGGSRTSFAPSRLRFLVFSFYSSPANDAPATRARRILKGTIDNARYQVFLFSLLFLVIPILILSLSRRTKFAALQLLSQRFVREHVLVEIGLPIIAPACGSYIFIVNTVRLSIDATSVPIGRPMRHPPYPDVSPDGSNDPWRWWCAVGVVFQSIFPRKSYGTLVIVHSFNLWIFVYRKQKVISLMEK